MLLSASGCLHSLLCRVVVSLVVVIDMDVFVTLLFAKCVSRQQGRDRVVTALKPVRAEQGRLPERSQVPERRSVAG